MRWYPEGEMGSGLGEGKAAFYLLIFFAALYLLTANGRIMNRDGEAVFQVTRSLVEKLDLAVPAEAVFLERVGLGQDKLSFATETAARGRDGRIYAKYGIGQSLASIPFYLLGRGLGMSLPGVEMPFATRFGVSLLNPIVSALTCALIFLWGRSLGYGERGALLLTFAYGLSTMAWVYSKSSFSEPLTTLLLLFSLYALLRGRTQAPGWLLASGASLGAAVLVRLPALLFAPPMLAYLFWPQGSSEALTKSRGYILQSLPLFLSPLALALLAVAAYNLMRFASPWATGYQTLGWETSPWVGLYGLLLSPGKGLLWYNPILILSLAGFPLLYKRRRAEVVLLLGISSLWIAFHSVYRFWEGGWSWGPRLLLPIIPLLISPMPDLFKPGSLHLPRRSFWIAPLLLISILLQLPAVGADYTRYLWSSRQVYGEGSYQRLIYQPLNSPLLGQWVSLSEVLSNLASAGGPGRIQAEVTERVRIRQVEGYPPEQASIALLEDTQLLGINFPDFWFLFLYLFGAPAWLSIGAALVLSATALAAFMKLGQLWTMATLPGADG